MDLAKKAFPLLTAILEPAIEFFKGCSIQS